MAEMWHPQSIEVLKGWCNAIENEASDKLTSWETNFIESISKQLDNNRQLSQRQEEILERIYAEKTS